MSDRLVLPYCMLHMHAPSIGMTYCIQHRTVPDRRPISLAFLPGLHTSFVNLITGYTIYLFSMVKSTPKPLLIAILGPRRARCLSSQGSFHTVSSIRRVQSHRSKLPRSLSPPSLSPRHRQTTHPLHIPNTFILSSLLVCPSLPYTFFAPD